MLVHPNIDPVALSVGPFKLHWYGIMYLVGLASAWILGWHRAKKSFTALNPDQVGECLLFGFFGLVIGGRVGHMLLYDFTKFMANPASIFQVSAGGMSFFGGMVGSMFGCLLFARLKKLHFLDLLDFFVPMVPIGLGAGRIGNFINGELWGRVTDSSIGMIFPRGGPLPRYPSQLVEALLEGLVIFVILWLISNKPRPRYTICAGFFVLYGVFRFMVEFIRQPEPQMGYLLYGTMTQGQAMSLILVVVGIAGLITIKQRRQQIYNPNAERYLRNGH